MYENAWVLENSIIKKFKVYIGNGKSKQGLSLYLKENKLFISVYQNHYMFRVPYTQKMLDAWSVEKAALSLKELNQEIRDTVGIFYQLSM